MKLNITKKLVPVLILGVVVYGVSKIGESDYNKEENNTNSIQTETTDLDYIVEDNQAEAELVKNEVVDEYILEEVKEEKEHKKEEVKTENIYGLELETKKVVVPTTTVNVRSSSTTESTKLGTISPSTKLDLIYQENEDWYKVKYNEEEAYISANYSKVEELKTIKNPLQKIVCFNKDSQLYNEYTNEFISVPKLEAAKVYKEQDEFYVAEINNKIGLIPKRDTEELNDTFVIVDISDQMAYLYEKNELIVETPVVTGKPSTPTTKGLHKVWDISANRYLKGADYKVYVDVMMAFHNGEGLHDAEYHTHTSSNGEKAFSHGWRGSNAFGGELYKTSGSHGCVNMPHDAAMTMYENIKLGDKVLVKE